VGDLAIVDWLSWGAVSFSSLTTRTPTIAVPILHFLLVICQDLYYCLVQRVGNLKGCGPTDAPDLAKKKATLNVESGPIHPRSSAL
jgi:hypothetical protein